MRPDVLGKLAVLGVFSRPLPMRNSNQARPAHRRHHRHGAWWLVTNRSGFATWPRPVRQSMDRQSRGKGRARPRRAFSLETPVRFLGEGLPSTALSERFYPIRRTAAIQRQCIVPDVFAGTAWSAVVEATPARQLCEFHAPVPGDLRPITGRCGMSLAGVLRIACSLKSSDLSSVACLQFDILPASL